MKNNPHKSCSCRACRAGATTAFGQYTHRATERRFRHAAKAQLTAIVAGTREQDAFDVILISTPYTD